MTFKSLVKIGIVLTLLMTGCRSPIVDNPCPRDAYFEPGDTHPLPVYDDAQRQAFIREDDDMRSFTPAALYVRERWKALERYCYQMRRR